MIVKNTFEVDGLNDMLHRTITLIARLPVPVLGTVDVSQLSRDPTEVLACGQTRLLWTKSNCLSDSPVSSWYIQ